MMFFATQTTDKTETSEIWKVIFGFARNMLCISYVFFIPLTQSTSDTLHNQNIISLLRGDKLVKIAI